MTYLLNGIAWIGAFLILVLTRCWSCWCGRLLAAAAVTRASAITNGIAGRTFAGQVRDVPEAWEKRYGGSRAGRYGATFVGGFLILFGARLAGGCTLGLFLSGATQMVPTSIPSSSMVM